jgi:DNA repair exonuclease SbcCD ATPase subunit
VSDLRIPEDLKELYDKDNSYGIAQYRGGDWPENWSHSDLAKLIEHIATQDAEIEQLKQQIKSERVLSRIMGVEDGISASDSEIEDLKQDLAAANAAGRDLTKASKEFDQASSAHRQNLWRLLFDGTNLIIANWIRG